MHRACILSFFISFSIMTLSYAQDTTVAEDSLRIANTLLSKDEIATEDSSLIDTQIILTSTDSLLNQESLSSIQLTDSLSSSSDDSIKDTTAAKNLPRRTIEITSNGIKKVFRAFFKYFRYFIFLVISCGIIFFAVSFYRRRIDSDRFLTSTRLSVMDREVQIACKYMESHYSDPELSVESMCEDLVTGPAFLEALFERELGMSVSEFLTQVRINRAKIILRKKPDSEAEDIAWLIGFSDKKLFFKKFKDITGVTFDEYGDASQNKELDL